MLFLETIAIILHIFIEFCFFLENFSFCAKFVLTQEEFEIYDPSMKIFA